MLFSCGWFFIGSILLLLMVLFRALSHGHSFVQRIGNFVFNPTNSCYCNGLAALSFKVVGLPVRESRSQAQPSFDIFYFASVLDLHVLSDIVAVIFLFFWSHRFMHSECSPEGSSRLLTMAQISTQVQISKQFSHLSHNHQELLIARPWILCGSDTIVKCIIKINAKT